jgi:hypothetical protein
MHAAFGPFQLVSQSVSYIFASRTGLIKCLATIAWPATNTTTQSTSVVIRIHPEKSFEAVWALSLSPLMEKAIASLIRLAAWLDAC